MPLIAFTLAEDQQRSVPTFAILTKPIPGHPFPLASYLQERMHLKMRGCQPALGKVLSSVARTMHGNTNPSFSDGAGAYLYNLTEGRLVVSGPSTARAF